MTVVMLFFFTVGEVAGVAESRHDICLRRQLIASAEGVDYVKKKLRKYDATLWVGNIDDELTAKAYIVPGLGDAGDLAYGEKE